MNSIPASQLVSVVPGVLGAGGNPLSLNAVFITEDPSVPIGAVLSFSTLEDVQDFFGPTSDEATLAAIYFDGFSGATVRPSTLYFVQFNDADVAAYLRSGSLSGMTLAQLEALSGTVIVVIDGRTITSANINLAAAGSFGGAAALIQTGLQTPGGAFQGQVTIDDGAGGVGDQMTVTLVTSGKLAVGDEVVGVGITGGTTILSQDSGTPGGLGVYTLSAPFDLGPGLAVTVASLATVAYDPQLHAFVISSPMEGDASTMAYATGTLAAAIKLQAAQGAVLSQGADAAVPADTMAAIVAVTQNWATFMTVFKPDEDVMLEFANWVNTSNDRYAYIAWDTNVVAEQADQPTTFGQLVADFDGVCSIYEGADGVGKIAAFICGATGSINFSETNGRITYAYKGQSGLPIAVTDATIANNLLGNGYNFYASYATANDQFNMFQNGSISGDWNWLDPYINQIYLNSQFQLAFMELLTQIKSVPYSDRGYAILRATAMDPINEALNFGSIVAGVTLSESQKAQVNTAADAVIAPTLENVGWYLKISDAPPDVRAVRGSPPMTFWYTDGGAIQKINLASIDVQ